MISNLLRDYGHRVLATDITDHLSLATRPDDPDLCRILSDMNRIPLKNEAVDVVWVTAAVHHSWNLTLFHRKLLFGKSPLERSFDELKYHFLTFLLRGVKIVRK